MFNKHINITNYQERIKHIKIVKYHTQNVQNQSKWFFIITKRGYNECNMLLELYHIIFVFEILFEVFYMEACMKYEKLIAFNIIKIKQYQNCVLLISNLKMYSKDISNVKRSLK